MIKPIHILCLITAIPISSSLDAFAGIASFLGFKPKVAQIIIIDGHEYSTAGLPKIYASNNQQVCTLTKLFDLFENDATGSLIPTKKLILNGSEYTGLPLIVIIQPDEKPARLRFRTAESMTTEYPLDRFSAHPLIQALIERLESEAALS